MSNYSLESTVVARMNLIFSELYKGPVFKMNWWFSVFNLDVYSWLLRSCSPILRLLNKSFPLLLALLSLVLLPFLCWTEPCFDFLRLLLSYLELLRFLWSLVWLTWVRFVLIADTFEASIMAVYLSFAITASLPKLRAIQFFGPFSLVIPASSGLQSMIERWFSCESCCTLLILINGLPSLLLTEDKGAIMFTLWES